MSVSRKQIAEAFKVALAHLWDGKCYADLYDRNNELDKFICHGLDRVKHQAGRSAIKIIEDRLEGVFCLEHWLADIKGISSAFTNTAKVQETRKAWLESLIEEFSK